MAPLTSGRVTIVASSMITTKVLSIRRVFYMKPNEPEVLLHDYPSHKRRQLPLVAKTCRASPRPIIFACGLTVVFSFLLFVF
ncbi:putative acyl-CoA oxidase [Helianthus annuus]|uniref:Acyl-CoA oxidase n=2 Tax=Helianthus annuus TaxID=4232 RepID=A0A9K3GX24_HELAN|nr:putative acyl-CoA oxidase [Helianthus annuus]KAJ0437027.1 putative acyl-CoA oxidase [Helianthus annuus]KAJ0441361.1 putative acyl-CoA oxidase [Helianthus annuus]KAJ0459337.1 putative acyl-CoA oxidase [Helianthus annuus]KAJ0643829.1 putative acyl-CoA oxidase [Helianthus annuus]